MVKVDESVVSSDNESKMGMQREVVDGIRSKIEAKGRLIRELKAVTTKADSDKGTKARLEKEIAELKTLKKEVDSESKKLEELERASGIVQDSDVLDSDAQFCRKNFDTIVKQKFIYGNAFSIYGGVAGLFDLGPMATALKNNIVQQWRAHFVQDESMMEIECTMLTPEPVLAASGHVERFTDLMVSDTVTGEFFRADHLVENALNDLLKTSTPKESAKLTPELRTEAEFLLATLDNYGSDPEKVHQVIQKFNIRSPVSVPTDGVSASSDGTGGNEVSYPKPFNLMFKTSIGPNSASVSYLRPETAQGIFVNFKRCLAIHAGTGGNQLPLGIAQVGYSFRNEISPRSGLLRVREFMMAEIEYFVHPAEKNTCPPFLEERVTQYLANRNLIADFIADGKEHLCDLVLTLLPAKQQELGNTKGLKISLRDAVDQNIINNNTLAFFLGKIFLFMVKIGVDPHKLRFRQHMCTEMAHYASDCWDTEAKLSYGWTEIVGCADRSAFDLTNHSLATSTDLSVVRMLPHNQIRTELFKTFVCDGKQFGSLFKKNASKITTYLTTIDTRTVEDIAAMVQNSTAPEILIRISSGEEFSVPVALLGQIKEDSRKISTETFVPNVIEPSFGIGRILYTVLEHTFHTRENDIQRTTFRFQPALAPIKVAILAISNNHPILDKVVRLVSGELGSAGISAKTDCSSTSIGRRYARFDSIGIPFTVTIDFESLDSSITDPTHTDLFSSNPAVMTHPTLTLRERDSMQQIRIPANSLITLVTDLVAGKLDWHHDVINKLYTAI